MERPICRQGTHKGGKNLGGGSKGGTLLGGGSMWLSWAFEKKGWANNHINHEPVI